MYHYQVRPAREVCHIPSIREVHGRELGELEDPVTHASTEDETMTKNMYKHTKLRHLGEVLENSLSEYSWLKSILRSWSQVEM